MEIIDREVDFIHYCDKCKHKKVAESMKPCYECLSEPIRQYTAKPLNWEAADGCEGYLAPEH